MRTEVYRKQNQEDSAQMQLAVSGFQPGYTFLFDRYFNIVKLFLYKNFHKVRDEVLEDVAIEVMEDWLLNVDTNPDVDKIGFKLCNQAKNRVFRILQKKFRPLPTSELFKDDDEEDYFINQTVYKIIAEGYDDDIAKLSFQLKMKVDKYIGELSDDDYNVITLFLEGKTKSHIEKKLNIPPMQIGHKIQKAFNALKRLVSGQTKNKNNVNKKWDEYRLLYLSNKQLCDHVDIMEAVYVDGLTINQTADKLGLTRDIVINRMKKDRNKMKS